MKRRKYKKEEKKDKNGNNNNNNNNKHIQTCKRIKRRVRGIYNRRQTKNESRRKPRRTVERKE